MKKRAVNRIRRNDQLLKLITVRCPFAQQSTRVLYSPLARISSLLEQTFAACCCDFATVNRWQPQQTAGITTPFDVQKINAANAIARLTLLSHPLMRVPFWHRSFGHLTRSDMCNPRHISKFVPSETNGNLYRSETSASGCRTDRNASADLAPQALVERSSFSLFTPLLK